MTPNLKNLSVAGSILQLPLPDRCPAMQSLTSLSIEKCSDLYQNTVTDGTEDREAEEQLRRGGTRGRKKKKELGSNEAMLYQLFSGMSSLTSLRLSHSLEIDGTVLPVMLNDKLCPHLRSLTLRDLPRLKDKVYFSFFF